MSSYMIYKVDQVSDQPTVTEARNLIDRIYKSDAFEVGKYHLNKEAIFYIDPLDLNDLMKTYVVLSGKLMDLKTKEIFGVGDLILVERAESLISLFTLEKTILLIHAHGPSSMARFEVNNKRLTDLLTDLQTKDHYTKEHSDRVFALVKKMALKLGYHSQALYDINKAARFHDVGKIYIDNQILNKPAHLTADEYEAIKKHATLGESLILSTFSDDVFKIIAQHHERINGSGYPLGLTGESICEAAKILAICDCYDAMTSDRVYSSGKTHEEAILELDMCAGTLYEPRLVEVFKDMFLESKC